MSTDNYYLRVKNGPGKGKKHLLKSEALVIGSSAEADIIFEMPGVDPTHAQIVFKGGQVILEDLGSMAGTFRNGQRLLGPLQVFPGDKIGIGPEVTIVLEGQDPRDAEPARGENPETNPGLAQGGIEKP